MLITKYSTHQMFSQIYTSPRYKMHTVYPVITQYSTHQMFSTIYTSQWYKMHTVYSVTNPVKTFHKDTDITMTAYPLYRVVAVAGCGNLLFTPGL